MTKTLICRRIIKKNNALFVCVFYVYSSEKTISSVTTQHFNNNCTPKKKHKKTKKLPVACQLNARQAKNFPPKINSCALCVRVLVFLV